ncbi:MAG: hypothetical protein GX139_03520 [Armatimonadetes bacterium]|jgi:lipopolysaccharide export system protein LptA|nr:hypothetical protein [Armatimonadota bacterium]
MRIALVTVIVICLLATSAFAAATKPTAGSATTKVQSRDGSFRLEAKTIMGSDNRFEAVGKAHLSRNDPVTKTVLEADAEKIVITTAPKAKSGMSIQTAELTGPVKMLYSITDENGSTTKTIATADSATFNGEAQTADLLGNVKITHENPAIFSTPAVMAGDKAVIYLNPDVGDNQYRFRVESTSGLSTITATPKSRQETD